LNVSATYYIATINDTEKSILAEEFITFVASPEGQQILADYGFLLLY
jgi:ABC-type molybdate transport system substrate-binding protein